MIDISLFQYMHTCSIKKIIPQSYTDTDDNQRVYFLCDNQHNGSCYDKESSDDINIFPSTFVSQITTKSCKKNSDDFIDSQLKSVLDACLYHDNGEEKPYGPIIDSFENGC